MAVGWNGADPVASVDPTQYELGTEFLVNQDITITHVRVWADATEINLTGRAGRVWTTGGAELGVATMPTDLPNGWSTHALTTPVERTAGSRFIVSFGTGGNEGALSHGLDADVPSADGAVTAIGFATATGGINGRFRVGVPGAFPNSGNSNHAFYGADIAYTLGIGGNTAPEIQAASVVASGLTATAAITATDVEGLTGATYRYDFGDNTPVESTNHPTNFKAHTYALPGTYPVLLSVTDSEGLSDYVARFITVDDVASDAVEVTEILDLLATRARRMKRFNVLTHEPRTAPNTKQQITAAFFLGAPNAAPGGFQTIKARSDLRHGALRLDVICRLYMSALTPVAWRGTPPSLDNIDNVLLENLEILMRECHAHVSFGIEDSGVWTDANGADSEGLGGLIGYLDHDNVKFRIAELYIPVILTTYFEQGE